jgi:hypothetical protein
MPYGALNQAQAQVVERFVRGQVVYDFGAANLYVSCELLRLGASKVIAIDKEPVRFRGIPKGIEFRQVLFRDVLDDPIDIAFVSWPPNYDTGLIPILRRARIILYLGKNTDGTACGTPDMFQYLLKRKAEYIPDRHNTLICYTDFLRVAREPLPEERASITSYSDTSFKLYDQVELA